jgi:hypothetical protein
MEAAADPTFDCGYAHSWHEEMRRAVNQRDVLPPAARAALVRVLERFLLEDEALGAAHADEVRRTITLLREPIRLSS